MDTGLFIALLNPTIALALGAAFLVLWSYQRHRPYLAVLALSYGVSAAGFLFQYFTLPVGMALTKLVSNICFTIAGCCLSGAIVARYGRKVPYVAIGMLAGGGLASFCWFLFVAAGSHLADPGDEFRLRRHQPACRRRTAAGAQQWPDREDPVRAVAAVGR